MMHLSKHLSFALAIFMFFMSIGITVHKMVCFVSGTVSFSLAQSDDCCANENKTENSLEAACCDYSTDYFKLDIQTLISNIQFKFDFFVADFFVPVFNFPELVSAHFSEVNHSPPLLSGKTILLLVSVFRV